MMQAAVSNLADARSKLPSSYLLWGAPVLSSIPRRSLDQGRRRRFAELRTAEAAVHLQIHTPSLFHSASDPSLSA